ncbi:MAG: L,D-transpeptidase [Paracoccus sp. (in: a-proteobacteria)]|uniref:L,D-transpeptidase n=1 Tax=Paracoccus sp. TaxID=267 RepID=UPI0026DFB368|nr:L,D-transpeptidase [Paracoccus sp. (in: a-proteobacteria)]MDO5622130.1 L,D-transpeptidase [Paracoccus sp. (in: a-proteobacteria)]
MRFTPIALAVALGVAACAPAPAPTANQAPIATMNMVPQEYQARVDKGPNGEPIDIVAVNPAYLNDRNRRQLVNYNGSEAPGTIVVDPYARFVYHVRSGGQAMRYGVSVGKAGQGFAGTGNIARKAAWPSWTPTANMVATQPDLYGPLKNGLSGGLHNPLGARALYLYKGNVDTMYRIHGTMDPSSIGKATSAGCIRMFNQDILDLYQEVDRNAPVVVRTAAQSRALEGDLVQDPQGYLVPAGQVAYAAQ